MTMSPACSLVVLGVLLLGVSLADDPLANNSVKVGDKVSKASSLLKIIYPQGQQSLPACERWSVCSRVDTYSRPWVERLCTCPGQPCSNSLRDDDGHTVTDRTRQYKVCESSSLLPRCRFFKDITWTHVTSSLDSSRFQQRVHCRCPDRSTTYISGRDTRTDGRGEVLYYYHFSCSPESSMRCRRKEPCRLFTVRKRFPVEEATTSTLCRCPAGTECPARHTHPFVLAASPARDGTRTYSGYCGTTTDP